MLATLLSQATEALAAPPPPLRERRSSVAPMISQAAARRGALMGIDQPRKYAEYLELPEKLVAVYRCVSVRSDAVAQGRMRWWARTSAGPAELGRGNPLTDLFVSVNDQLSLRDLLRHTTWSADCTGNAYWELVRLGNRLTGPVTEIWPLRPSRVEVIPDEQAGGVKAYKFTVDSSRPVTIERERIFHLRYTNPNHDWYGLAPIVAGARAAVADTRYEAATDAMLRRGCRPSAILTMDVGGGSETLKEAIDVLMDRHSGVENWGKIIGVEGGRDLKPIQLGPVEMEALKSRQWNQAQIRTVYGVPPIVYGLEPDDQSATRENTREQRRQFQESTVEGIAGLIADQISERLIPMLGYGLEVGEVWCELDYSQAPIYRELRAEEARANARTVQFGVVTINEVREQLGLDPVPWGETWWGMADRISPIASRAEPAR